MRHFSVMHECNDHLRNTKHEHSLFQQYISNANHHSYRLHQNKNTNSKQQTRPSASSVEFQIGRNICFMAPHYMTPTIDSDQRIT